MAINDIWKFQIGIVGGVGNMHLSNTFHYRQETATIFDDAFEDLVQAWRLSTEALYTELFSDQYSIEMYKVRLEPDQATGGDFPITLVPGQLGGDQAIGQVNGYYNIRTAMIGRRYRGGVHLPPPDENMILNGGFVGSYITAADAWYAGAKLIGDGLTTAEYQLGVFSTKWDTFTPATGGFLSLIPSTLQSRKPGRGS